MTPTDTLTCQITPDSVEPTSLACSVPPLEYLNLWTTLGAWATVGATLLLGYFAWKAWSTSRSTLRAMEKQLEAMKRQEETSYKAALAQLQSATDLASAERKDRVAMAAKEALANHLTAWFSVRVAILQRDPDLPTKVQSAEATGIVWRMLHSDQKKQLTIGLEWSKLITKAARIEIDQGGRTGKTYATRRIAIVDALDQMIELFQVWETDESSRSDTSTKMALEKVRFENENETLKANRQLIEEARAVKAQTESAIKTIRQRSSNTS